MRLKNGQVKLYQLKVAWEIKRRESYKTEGQADEQHQQPAFPLQPGTPISPVRKKEVPTGDGGSLCVHVPLVCFCT